MKFKKAYVRQERNGTVNTDEVMTEQNHMRQCDINVILGKAAQTQTIGHVTQYEEMYGAITPDDLLQSMIEVKKAEHMFQDLPAKLRNKFENKPYLFLEFVQNPANKSEMEELGLVRKKQPPMANLNDVVSAISKQQEEAKSNE